MTEAELIAASARELENRRGLELQLRPQTVLSLCALLQLVQRHPRLQEHDTASYTAAMILEHGRLYFADCPATLELLRRGDDPRNDT